MAKPCMYAICATRSAIWNDTSWMLAKGGYTRPIAKSESVTCSARACSGNTMHGNTIDMRISKKLFQVYDLTFSRLKETSKRNPLKIDEHF